MQINKGIIPGAKKIVIYGPEGIGKTTLASDFPDPLFLDTEGGTKAMDVKRFDAPKNWEDIIEAIKMVKTDTSLCKTLVVDTADWAEMLCIKFICKKNGVNGIEDFGYGKGYTYLQESFKKFLDELDELIKLGINVIVTAHAKMRKFEQPDEMGAYDRWEMKLTRQVGPMLKEWADMVLFANYKTFVIEDDKTKSKKAQGGKRVMYTTHNPCWDAKNRYGLKDCIPLEYSEIKAVIEDTPKTKKAKKTEEKTEPAVTKEAPAVPEYLARLKELMTKDGIDEERLIFAVASKGGCFTGEKIESLDPEFVQKSLIDKWSGFVKYAKKLDITMEEVPFEE